MSCPSGPGYSGSRSTTTTETVEENATNNYVVPCLHLRLEPDEKRAVSWTTDTVDNEHLNKKKSKCCCIYEKPHAWNESSSESECDAECDHCRGHVEKKAKKKNKKPNNSHGGDGDATKDAQPDNADVEKRT